MATEGNNVSLVKRSRSRSPISRDNSNQKSDRYRPRDRSRGDRLERRDGGGGRVGKCARIMVSNLPYEMKWQEVKDYFRDKIGEVLYVQMEVENGKSTGRCLVEFRSAEMATKAINELHWTKFKGRNMGVCGHNGPEPIRDRGDRGGRGGMMDRMDGKRDNNFNTYGLQQELLESLGISGPLTAKVLVANLDYNVTEKKVQEVFMLAGNMIKCTLRTDSDGKSRGQAVVEYEHPIEAVQAVSMFNGQSLFDQNMSVRMDKNQDDGGALPSGLRGIGRGLGERGQPISNVAPIGRGPVGGGIGMGMANNGGNPYYEELVNRIRTLEQQSKQTNARFTKLDLDFKKLISMLNSAKGKVAAFVVTGSTKEPSQDIAEVVEKAAEGRLQDG